jgi:hypothetical protein
MSISTDIEVTRLRGMTATEHVRELNASTRAWVAEKPESRWACLLVEDPAHWVEYQCTTGHDLARYLIVQDYWETYKDVHGVRPRHVSFEGMTLQECEAKLDADFPALPPREVAL